METPKTKRPEERSQQDKQPQKDSAPAKVPERDQQPPEREQDNLPGGGGSFESR